ncbi:MAG: hypothetical protein LBC85_08290 [Fibromonadaceae bacterium]|jgi:hypothetical protein|nr:hypothetical protein [Fibromonadaceae bacterium]
MDNELFLGNGSIEIETDELEVKNIDEFISAIKPAQNFEIHPLLNGNLSMSICFKDLTKEVNLTE